MHRNDYYCRNPYEPPLPQQQLTPYEQRLRDEVIYLHSLWHEGPPPTRDPPPPPPIAHFPFPNNSPSHSTYYLNYRPTRALHVVSNPRPFKKKSKKKKKRPMNDMVQDPGPEWPVNSPVRSPPGWPAFESKMERSARFVPVSDEVMAGIASKVMQRKVVESCRRFLFGNRVGSVLSEGGESGKGDDGEEEELDEEEDEEEEDEEGSSDEEREEEGSEEYKFLLGLFIENQELREFYEKNLESGDLYCLVCGGIGVKVWKSFKGCMSLVQHSIAISKTKRRRAHRAYGQVVCEVLGWDFDRLPAIVSKGDPLGQSLANLSRTQAKKSDQNVEQGGKGSCGCLDDSGDKVVGGEASGDTKNNAEVGVSENHVRDLGDDKLNEDLAVGTPTAAESSEHVNNEELSKEDAGKTINNVDNQVLPAGANKEGDPDCVDNGVNKQ